MFPENDTEFEECLVKHVTKHADNSWSIEREDGFSFFVPETSPVAPVVGDTARFYGKGIGYNVRGLYLNNVQVFYRTESEEKEHHEITFYGKDAQDWLDRWDAEKNVWSISMGGMGPGYEQAIQIIAAEMVRAMLARKYDHEAWQTDKDLWDKDRKEIESTVEAVERVKAIGCSGAQWGAAFNLALQFYRRGPRAVMTDAAVKDRHIQVRSSFP